MDTNKICLPFNYYVIIFCLIVGLTVWYIHLDKKKNNSNNYNYNDNIINKLEKLLKHNSFKEDKLYNNLYRDRKVLYDDFYPPERRYNNLVYNTNIPTRGYPENYQLLGIIIRNNPETAYNLFGRQLYPGSNQYEYYIEGNMKDTKIKIPIKIPGNKEIEDNQTIDIPGMNNENSPFTVKLYDYESPRYNPYLIY
jgi:hypothetical protein